jgi:hypothetical protein
MTVNLYCSVLDIDPPTLEQVRDHPDANTYSLLITALLERGGPMTLAEVAKRFDQAGIAPAFAALRSLQRCRPDRPPVVRDGDHYAIDPHDDEADLWAFRLGLKPPRGPRLRLVPADPGPLPGPDTPLTPAEIDEAFRDAGLSGWSARRIAVAVLDSRGGRARPEEVQATVDGLTRYHIFRPGSLQIRRGSPVVEEDGVWVLDPEYGEAVRSARTAVRARVESVRERRAQYPTPEEVARISRHVEAERAARAAKLAQLRRVVLHAFPADRPAVVTLVDFAERRVETLLGEDVHRAPNLLAAYDVIAATGVRPIMRALGFDPGERWLCEISPPQKSIALRRGRTLRITLPMLVQGSCAIARPFAEAATLHRYVESGDTDRLRARMEDDARSLYALFRYARTQGAVRLRYRSLDEMLPVPWLHRDEPTLYHLMSRAFERDEPLQAVVGETPGWDDPWRRAEPLVVEQVARYQLALFDSEGAWIDRRDIQIARLAGEVGGG